ncbi:MAG: hypothetical protein WB780_05845 [Candidatus Acidiferrales bacterium]
MDKKTEAILSAVASMIADVRAETETLRQLFVSQGSRMDRLEGIRKAVQTEVLPTLQVEAHRELTERFSRLLAAQG